VLANRKFNLGEEAIMEKKKILVIGLIGLLLAVGLYLIGCDQPDKCDGKCWYGRDHWQDTGDTPYHYGCSDYEKGACYKDCKAYTSWRNKDNYNGYFKYTCDCK
jgi:hypothetical protein